MNSTRSRAQMRSAVTCEMSGFGPAPAQASYLRPSDLSRQPALRARTPFAARSRRLQTSVLWVARHITR